jgi:alpha-beta hydrolase superfamily lysophospholipase
MAARARRRAAWLSALAALALAGCAVGGPLDAPPAVPAPATPHLTAADGSPLVLSEWRADAPRAIILGVHGYGDYGASTFASAAAFWASRGLTTYAYDQRGFGRNASFGRWPGAAALVADLQGAVRQLRGRHPCLPLVVVGHSMGGGVALAAAGQGLEADGLVLAAPAIWGGEEMNPLHRLAAWGGAALMPEHRFTGRGLVEIQASDNIEVLRALGRDPHYLRPPSARELLGLVRVADMAAAAAPRARLPALLLLGDRDEIVPAAAVRRVFTRLGRPRREIDYPEGWHLLFRDLQAARVWRDVADWVGGIRPPAPCAAATG